MPYRLVQFPDGYRVMTEETGAFHSKDALPLARAKRQMTALNLALARERGHDVPPPPTAKGGARTYREKFLDRYELPDRSYSLEEVSKITSVPMDILQEVYNRGIGAYKTNPRSVRLKGSFVKNVDAPLSKKLSKEQWAMARVMSFVMGNPKHDNDLRANKVRGGMGMERKMETMAARYRADINPRIFKELYDNALVAISQLRRRNLTKFLEGLAATAATAGALTTTVMASSLNPFAIAIGVPTYLLFRFIKDRETERDALKQRVIDTLEDYFERLTEVPPAEQPRVYQEILAEQGRLPTRPRRSAVRDVFAPPPPPPREEAPSTTAAVTRERSAVRDVVPAYVPPPFVPPPPPPLEQPRRERVAFEPQQARGSVGPSVREIARAINVEQRPLGEALEGRRVGKGRLLSTPLPAVPPPKDDAYLTLARKRARDAGIEGRITYAPKPHKLQIETPDGRVVKFGRQGYGDFLLWSRAEAEGKVPKGTADTKRRLYRARATKIKGDWKKDTYSPNNLAINILW